MAVEKIQKDTFKKGSKTYFTSSIFFPRAVRDDVFILYAFVRTADDFVDSIPQDPEGFYRFRGRYSRAVEGSPADDVIIDSFVELMRRKQFAREWVDAFLDSMEMDLEKSTYDSLEETLRYIYGSAEVIGLFMASIMDLPEASHEAARMLGRAMQYINFIRDIDEDISLGRTYLPLSGSGLKSLEKAYVEEHRDEFKTFVRENIALYRQWQEKAEAGYHYIPKRYLIPIKTAADMYRWTAEVIEKDPFVVFERKVKPSKGKIIATVIGNIGTSRDTLQVGRR